MMCRRTQSVARGYLIEQGYNVRAAYTRQRVTQMRIAHMLIKILMIGECTIRSLPSTTAA
jgi:hypothetical protein